MLDVPRTRFDLRAIPDGDWHIRAAAVATRDAKDPWQREPAFVQSRRVTLGADARVLDLDLTLHPTGVLDPPILTALPELDSRQVPGEVRANPRSSGESGVAEYR